MEKEILEAQQKLMQKRADLGVQNRGKDLSLTSILEQPDGPTVSDKKCEIHDVYLKISNSIFSENVREYCEECANDREKQRQEDELASQRAEKQRRIARNFNECQIGKRFSGIKFDSYKPTNEKAKNILEKCEIYAATFDRNLSLGASLILLGLPGTGKNHLAAAICTEILNQEYTALHTTVMKMIRRVKSTWSREAEETEQRAILSFCEPDLLVIDEVGVQFGSETEKLLLTEIINERYERVRPTILISNLNMKNLTEVLGERVVDRFRDAGEVLVFDWESWRRKA